MSSMSRSPDKAKAVCLEVWRDNEVQKTVDLSSKSRFTLGRNADMCDIGLDHISASHSNY